MAHLVHGEGHHGPDGLAITTFFTLYSNVVAEKVRQRVMFFGMAGIATMAATVPHGMGERSAVFAASSAAGATARS